MIIVILSLVSLILLLGTSVRNTVYEYVPSSEAQIDTDVPRTSISADNRWDYEGYNFTEYAEQYHYFDSVDNNTDIAITNLLTITINFTGAPSDTEFRLKDWTFHIGGVTDIITFHDTALNHWVYNAGPGGAPNVQYGGWNGWSHPISKNYNYSFSPSNLTATGAHVYPLELDSSTSFDWSDGVEMYYLVFQMAYVGQSVNFSGCDPGTGPDATRIASPPYLGDVHSNITTDQKFPGDWNINETWNGEFMGWFTEDNLFNITHNHTTAEYSLNGIDWYDFPRTGIKINESGYHTIGINVSQGMWNIAKTYDIQVDVTGPSLTETTDYRKLPYTIESDGTVSFTITDDDSGLGNSSLYLDNILQTISFTGTLTQKVDDWEEDDHTIKLIATDLVGNEANITHEITVSDASEFASAEPLDYTDLLIAIIGISGTGVAAAITIWKSAMARRKKKRKSSILSKIQDYFRK